jgi:hypothetical protein
MSFDYVSMGVTADELISEFGAAAVLSRTTSGGYDPETGISAPQSTTLQNVTAVCIDYSAEFVDGTLILRGDKQVFLSANGVTLPAAGDKFAWQGGEYSVIAVTPLAPNGITTLLYELQIRR